MRVKQAISGRRESRAEESARAKSLQQKRAEVFLEVDKVASVAAAVLTRRDVEGGEVREISWRAFRPLQIFHSE